MKRMLINAAQAEELRVALVQNSSLYDLIVERAGFEQKVGNIYKAKITSIEPSLDAVFVDYGCDRHGFLPVKEISRDYFLKKVSHDARPDIREVLKLGQEIMIQVEKEERGNKGAALTTYISLAGSYIVLMPNNPRAGGISRRIEGDERDELKDILSKLNLSDDMGLIVRTAGVGKSYEEVQWDLDVLTTHWEAIKQAFDSRPGPFLIHQEGDIVIRAIRDYLRADITELLIDDAETFKKAQEYIKQVRPEFLERVKLYEEQVPLFTQFEIEQQIETAYKRTVHLPSGGSIVIDHTEALVAIDINSAGSTKGQNIEQTALSTNMEAAEEIGRQMRLRDIGGLIVIDFIDMMQIKHQREVENAILNALRLDRARVQISRISRFGLLEMSRQRLRPSLRETIQHVCPTCNGHGSVRSIESIALSILRIIEEEAIKPNTGEIQVQASSDTATYILNEKRSFIQNIEKTHDITVLVIPNPNLQQHNYNFKRLRRLDSDTSLRHKASYHHLKTVEVNKTTSRSTESRTINEPAVKSVLPNRSDIDTKENSGLIKRLWSSMFGPAEEDEVTTSGSSGSSGRSQSTQRNQSSSNAGQSRRTQSNQQGRQRSDNRQKNSQSNQRRDDNQRKDNSQQKQNQNQSRNRRPQSGNTTSNDKRKSSSRELESTYKEYSQTSEEKATDTTAKARTRPQSQNTPLQQDKPKTTSGFEQKQPAPVKKIEPTNQEPLVVRPKSDTESATKAVEKAKETGDKPEQKQMPEVKMTAPTPEEKPKSEVNTTETKQAPKSKTKPKVAATPKEAKPAQQNDGKEASATTQNSSVEKKTPETADNEDKS